MVKLKGKRNKKTVTISHDSFEHLLSCLDNQKFINDVNADGLVSGDYQTVQADNQAAIDDFNRQCRGLLHDSHE